MRAEEARLAHWPGRELTKRILRQPRENRLNLAELGKSFMFSASRHRDRVNPATRLHQSRGTSESPDTPRFLYVCQAAGGSGK